MALIKCPDCHSDISDRSKACPNCGYRFNAMSIKERNEVVKLILVIAGIVIFMVLFIFAFDKYMPTQDKSDKSFRETAVAYHENQTQNKNNS